MRYTSNWTGSTLLLGNELEIGSELVIELLGAEDDALELTTELVSLEGGALELTTELLGNELEIGSELVIELLEAEDDALELTTELSLEEVMTSEEVTGLKEPPTLLEDEGV